MLELVISVQTATLILAGMFTCLALVGQSTRYKSETGDARFWGALVTERMVDDLSQALSIAERSATAIEVTVPDRNGDGMDDKVRYYWNAQAGTPLWYRLNDQTPEAIWASVQQLALNYPMTTQVLPARQPSLASLNYHDDQPGALNESFVLTQSSQRAAQYILHSNNLGGSYWALKRLRFLARRSGQPDGTILVQLTTADNNQKPTSTVIDRITVDEASLGQQFGWVNIDFTAANQLIVGQGYCVVLSRDSISGDAAGEIMFQQSTGGQALTANTHWMTSNNGGNTWTNPNTTQDIRFQALGTFANYTAPVIQRVHSVGITIQTGPDASSRISTTAQLQHAPRAWP
jgi:hypothetical protein